MKFGFKIILTTSLNYRLKHALNEIDAKKAAVRKLREDLNRSEMTLTKSQNRETHLECELEAAEAEIEKFKNEVRDQKGM